MLIACFANSFSATCVAQEKTQAKDSEVKRDPSGYTEWLQVRGVETTKEGIADYLSSLKLTESARKRTVALIAELSDNDYIVRENATKRLMLLSGATAAFLNTVSDDLVDTTEGKYRLNMVRKALEQQKHAQVQFAVFRVIETGEISGLANAIINSYPQLEKQTYVMTGFIGAISSSALKSDEKFLTTTLRDKNSALPIRIGCLKGLARIAPAAATDLAIPLRNSKGKLGLAVAKVLVASEKIECFETLKVLLTDKESTTRLSALNVLRSTCQLSFEDNYLRNKEDIAKAVKQTEDWLANQDANEIEYAWETKALNLGRRLISHYDKNVVVELDESDNIVWSTNAKKPFTCMGLPNGHRLIVEYQTGTLLFFDESGKEIKKFEKLSGSMSGICRCPNGNFIIAAGQNDNQIFEIDPLGKKVETFTVKGTPTSVEIGLNGNLLIALYKQKELVELSRSGKVIRRIPVEGAPYHAKPLKNGNFLVSFARDKKIAEYDATGTEVWKHECATGSYHAQEMDDGSIVFSASTGIHRINRSGETIKSTDLSVSGSIHYSYSY